MPTRVWRCWECGEIWTFGAQAPTMRLGMYTDCGCRIVVKEWPYCVNCEIFIEIAFAPSHFARSGHLRLASSAYASVN